MDISIVVAIVGTIGVIIAAVMSAMAQRNVRRLEERFETFKQETDFLNDQLSKLYLPISMHMRATEVLAKTHYGSGESTIIEIEHRLREHNKKILDCLMKYSMYLEPTAPEEVTTNLLMHLLQWESVYKLKYESHAIEGPIWDGIRKSNFSKFPDEAAIHFHTTEKKLRKVLHERLLKGI